ncbi:hypothetical protein [Helicobacter sp. MIT 14-3879]|uniref:hypothetical protein n=1 Tax=Helicobacter sp. MIT 14-3879 TaxID=2040649 RepID=UPI002163AAA5|nr:hypothetical protein [Helicobacter sp. MIT 14-3879]
MANIGYKVIQYDASISKAPYNHPNIIFHKKFVGVNDGEDIIAFDRLIKENSLNKDCHNILQIDIEDCEWDILDSVNLGLINKYFSQAIFEFHNCNPNDEKLSQKRLRILEKLRDYYTPIHTHFNNYGNVFYNSGLFWCDVIEVSYMRNDLIPKDAKLKIGLGNLTGLDSPNAMYYPDIPILFDNL